MSSNLPARRPDPEPSGLRSRWTGLAPAVAGTLLAGATLAVGLSFLLVYLLLGVSPRGDLPPGTSAAVLDVIKVALAVVAGLGGAVALVVSYRRQRHLELDEAGTREKEKAFRDRYGAAAQQLGDPEPSVRLAGVYAMAYLADDWNEQRQQCVDVLCAYLRLPWSGNDDQVGTSVAERSWMDEEDGSQRKESRSITARPGEREVRRTLIRVIASHLRADAAVSWSHFDFDFRSAHLPDADFSHADFLGLTDFGSATFSGVSTNFRDANFSGVSTDFTGATFSTRFINFTKATFSSARTEFRQAMFSATTTTDFVEAAFLGELTSFAFATFLGQDTKFNRATFSGKMTKFRRTTFSADLTDFEGATFSGGQIDFGDTSFSGIADFNQATFSGHTANFSEATFSGGYTSFIEATFSGKRAFFAEAVFSGDQTSFDGAMFSGGRPDFDGVTFSEDLPDYLKPFMRPPPTQTGEA